MLVVSLLPVLRPQVSKDAIFDLFELAMREIAYVQRVIVPILLEYRLG